MFGYSGKSNQNNHILKRNCDYEPNSQGLGHELFKAMNKNKDKIAQYIADTDEEDTYGSLLTRSIRTALHIKHKGLTKDDIICICSKNSINSCVPFVASMFLGIKFGGLDPSLSINDTAHLIKQVKPRLIFVEDEAVELIEKSLKIAELRSTLVVFGKSEKHEEFSEYLQPKKDEDNFKPEDISSNKNTAIILFSSGTTGLPKGICLSHYGLLGQVFICSSYLKMNVALHYSSLYWITSSLLFICVALKGFSRVVCRDFDPIQIWHILHKYKVTYVFLATNLAIEMANVGRPDNIVISNDLAITSGGSVLSRRYVEKLRNLLPEAIIAPAYGQTEVSGFIATFNMNDPKDINYLQNKLESCGRPLVCFMYKVVDPETEEILGANKQGELRLKSKLLFNEYYNLDTSSAYDSDGWLKTGDIVYYDEDECFYVVDRIKEMLKYKSFHVPPAVLEQVINDHPAVQKSVVIGIPHELDGDHPMGIVMLKKGAENVQPEDVKNYVTQRVSDRQKLRAGVKFVEQIPTTATGKFNRKLIRDMAMRGEI